MTDERFHDNESVMVMLARIDERTHNTQTRVDSLVTDVANLRREVTSDFISRTEYKGLEEKVRLHQRILFGTVGIICFTVLGAVLALVLNR